MIKTSISWGFIFIITCICYIIKLFDDLYYNVYSARECVIDSYKVTGNDIKDCFKKELKYKIK